MHVCVRFLQTSLGGIHLSETRKRFLDGTLHPSNVLMCPHTCVTNLPKPREPQSDIGPASVMVGSIVQGVRLAEAKGRDLNIVDDDTETTKKVSDGNLVFCIGDVMAPRSHSMLLRES